TPGDGRPAAKARFWKDNDVRRGGKPRRTFFIFGQGGWRMRRLRLGLCVAAGSAAMMAGQAASAQAAADPPTPSDGFTDAPAAAVSPPPPPAPKPPSGTMSEAVAAGHLILEMRARYEQVDQVGIALTATAPTLRTRLGWETG